MILPPTFSSPIKTSIYAVIETPKGSRSKYDYDEEHDYFKLNKILPSGTSFPLDFGFIPHTRGEDGDPIDVLVIADTSCFPGCIVECRVIGVIVAKQREKDKKVVRNDRILAVSSESLDYSHIRDIADLNKSLVNELIHFFEYYNAMSGKKFQLLQKGGQKKALQLIKDGII